VALFAPHFFVREGQASEMAAPARANSSRNAGADFCISGGAPVVGEPRIAGDGSVHFLTSDSYLHSFEADGRFRSSYTLDGSVEFGLGERPDGALFAMTTRGGLYAWEVTGQLRFFRALGARPLAPPVLLGEGRIGFTAIPGQFWAVGAWGETIYRVPLRGAPSAAEVVGDQVWLVRGAEIVALEAAWRQHVLQLPGPIAELDSPGGQAPAYAQVGDVLYQITHKRGVPSSIRPYADRVVSFGAGEGKLAVVRKAPSGEALEFELSDPEGRVLRRVSAPFRGWAPPSVTREAVYFPTGKSVFRLSNDSTTELVFASDFGRRVVARGVTLASVRKGHLVCVAQLHPVAIETGKPVPPRRAAPSRPR
jgi:hypothetical protein